MAPHVVVPFDGTPQANDALDYALEHFPDAELTLLRVIVPDRDYDDDALISIYGYPTVDGGDIDEEMERAKRRAEESLESARARAEDRGATVSTAVWHGPPGKAVVRFLEDADADHVVIGSHGRSGIAEVLLGSVASHVSRHSPVPVTIVR